MRPPSRRGERVRLGFRDPERIDALTSGWPAGLLDDVAAGPDPDGTAARIAAILDDAAARSRLSTDERLRRRVVALAGASDELARGLARHPEDLDAVAPAAEVGEGERVGTPDADPLLAAAREATSADELRRAYRRAIIAIATDDVCSLDPAAAQPQISRRLSALAGAVLQAAYRLAGAETQPVGTRLAVLAMGKCGAQELNVASDVDVIFVVEPEEGVSAEQAVREGTRWASALMRICSAHTPAGTIWPVDANLRPEGKQGPLVRTLESMCGYYRDWAKPWEFQALLKARAVAGDRELADAFCALVEPLVWRVADSPGFVADTQAMRRRVVSLLPSRTAERELKLGAGGLRDVEFTVQLLQLIHGRTDESLRVRGTLEGLQALIDGGYVGRHDGAELADAYRWLRTLEHRIQLLQLRRTHTVPDDPATLARLSAELGVDVAERFGATRRRVLQLHRRLFYSPLLAAVATVKTDELALDPAAAQARLQALGYLDARQGLRHIEALTIGVSRAAGIRRQLMPALLGWFAEAANPDAALLAFRQVSDALGSSPWYLRALRDEGAMAERLARVLGAGRYPVGLILRDPEAVSMLADEAALTPRPAAELADAMAAVAARHQDPADAVAAIRTVRRRELLRLAAADCLDVHDIEHTQAALADLTSASVETALGVASRGSECRVGVLALGRWGGRESSYASDADAMFVVADASDVAEGARIVTELRRLLAAPGPDPALAVDADLRPEGKNGPLVRALDSYLAYFGRWSSAWEAQALLRARHGAGEPDLTGALLGAVAPLRWPEAGPSADALAQMRRLKARMETERAGRDAARNVKLGPGGLSDVEWCAQLLQLRYAAAHPELRDTRTLPVLSAAADLGLIDPDDATALATAWRLASRIRNAVMLVRGRASDSVPADAQVAAAVAQLLGYGRSGAAELAEDWLRAARRARGVADRVFWAD